VEPRILRSAPTLSSAAPGFLAVFGLSAQHLPSLLEK
jgi:hypothetical protein